MLSEFITITNKYSPLLKGRNCHAVWKQNQITSFFKETKLSKTYQLEVKGWQSNNRQKSI